MLMNFKIIVDGCKGYVASIKLKQNYQKYVSTIKFVAAVFLNM